MQTGDYRSEHSFSATSQMSSGCQAAANTYCTIRLTNTTTGYDRYLPYSLVGTTSAGWSWSGGILTSSEWRVSAIQGTATSGNYLLFSK